MPPVSFRSLRLAACVSLAFVSAAGFAAVAGKTEPAALDDAKVANFAIPDTDYSSAAFEQFSFRVDRDGRQRIDYGYGAPYREIAVRQVAGTPGSKGFAVRFPNGHVFDIVPVGDTLVVSDRDSGYRKTFAWRYEGPVDGRGTFCTPCVEESDAMGFVVKHFIKTGQ